MKYKFTIAVLLAAGISSAAVAQQKKDSTKSTFDTTQAFFIVSAIPNKEPVQMYALGGFEIWKQDINNKTGSGPAKSDNGRKLMARLTADKKPLKSSLIIWQTLR